MIVENVLFEAIRDQIAWFREDLRRMESFLRKIGVGETEAAGVRAYLADRDWRAVHGYPRATGPFPCYALILVGDSIRQSYLGDDADAGDDDDDIDDDLDGQEGAVIGRLIQWQFDVETWASGSPDVCRYLYHLLRHMIFSSVGVLAGEGISNVEWQGRDINPQSRYLPEDLWVRALRVTCEAEDRAWETKGAGATISGAFVEGSTEDDVETVTRGIVPFTEE